MKNSKKALLMILCIVALVACSVFATLAYFTDSEAVTNTFSVGQVHIDLDEQDVDNSSENDRDKANKYHLIPGNTYVKDPIVHIDASSESAWVFVKVENSIWKIEAATKIHDQIIEKGWTELSTNVTVPEDDANNTTVRVYYKQWDKTANAADRDLEVFDTFKIDGEKVVNGTAPDGKYNIADYADAKVTITAYAIQMAGFEGKPSEAWDAGNWS